MELERSIQGRLDASFKNFLQLISEHYKLDFKRLCDFAATVDLQTGKTPKDVFTCMHIMTRGINKGKSCTSKSLENGYCGKHQGSASNIIGTIIEKTGRSAKKPKEMTKTQLQIIEWLNTAVPQKETVLKKRSKGLIHDETDIIFNDEFMVIGRVDGETIVKLSRFELELCENRGWKYDVDAVESEE